MGIIFHMYSPEIRRRHNITLYMEINTDVILSQALKTDLKQYRIYSNQGAFDTTLDSGR